MTLSSTGLLIFPRAAAIKLTDTSTPHKNNYENDDENQDDCSSTYIHSKYSFAGLMTLIDARTLAEELALLNSGMRVRAFIVVSVATS